MKAMILAAGFGTRLKPITDNLPKPLFPVLNRPILEHTLQFLSKQGIREIAINLHHQPEKIIDYFGDGKDFGVNLHYSKEEEILGTAGGIKKLQSFLKDETFLVINSDVLADIDLNNALEFHKEKKSKLTLVVRQDSNTEKYKPILRTEEGRIVNFLGHTINNSDPTTQVMFTGIQIMEPDIFSRIPENKFCGTTEDVFPGMIKDELPVYGYLHEGYWIDMGTRETYIQAQVDAMDGKLLLKTTSSRNPEGPLVVPPVHIGRNCEISKDAQVGPYAVLGDGCRVRSGAVVERSVLFQGATVGSGLTVKNSVIGEGVAIAKNIENQSLASEA
ncbi:MAG: NDP-sugar synthase [Nitrospina sp.]|jgi:NDP-sugar pyrophosphorylase family protein|nr:NDP-sugar synthase [Nitrospina sp.]MBT6717648.1 NDP-sugar synthase [Nitrospina sp.]